MQMLEEIFSHRMWKPVNGYDYVCYRKEEAPKVDCGIIIIPGRHCLNQYQEINAYVNRWRYVIFVVCGDEESIFPVQALMHPKRHQKLWIMDPRPGTYDRADHFILNGYTQEIRNLPVACPFKTQDIFFSGQIRDNISRKRLRDFYYRMGFTPVEDTDGFMQGFSPREYLQKMAETKVAPCPSGPCTPDTFRLAEALEAGCIPVVNTKPIMNNEETKPDYPEGFFELVLSNDIPFPVLKSWREFDDLYPHLLADWPRNANRISAWWMNLKRNMAYWMRDDIAELENASR
jgi:hypothetical protein